MSSLAAAQADGYYYPPGWKPEHGSLNRSQGSNGALGHRARKLHLGIMVVRFELPHNSWCLGCGCHIARGVRYNAEKARVGMFMTSPIHEFHMTCRRCSHPFVIRTDPEASDYNYVSGIKRKATAVEDAVDPAVAVDVAPARDKEGNRIGEAKPVGLEHLEAENDRRERAGAAATRLSSLRRFKAHSDAIESSVNRSARLELRASKREAASPDLQAEEESIPKRAALHAVASQARRGRFRRADDESHPDHDAGAWKGVGRSMAVAAGSQRRRRRRTGRQQLSSDAASTGTAAIGSATSGGKAAVAGMALLAVYASDDD